MIFTTSWDDGDILDIRLALLLLEYNIPATFYIPTNCSLSDDEIRYLSDKFKIGGHTLSHPKDLKLLDNSSQYAEIKKNKEWLEFITKKEIDSFCYPSGRYNDTTISNVVKAGFKEARTTYSGNIEIPIDKYRIRPSVHVYPQNDKFKKPDWFSEADKLFKEAKEKNGYFHLWGHSWEIEKFNQWDNLEKFFKNINGGMV